MRAIAAAIADDDKPTSDAEVVIYYSVVEGGIQLESRDDGLYYRVDDGEWFPASESRDQ